MCGPDRAAIDAAATLAALAPCVILAGQAGVGKTTLAVSLAIDAADAGEDVTVIDLDIVNPYFRSTEARTLLEAHGVRLIAPQFAEAGSNLDAPGLTAAIEPAIEGFLADACGRRLIIDLGGEADGARTLGRFAAPLLSSKAWGAYGVVNAFRPFNDAPTQTAAELLEIAAASRVDLSAIINNSHLMEATTLETLSAGRCFGKAVAEAAGVPFAATTVPRALLGSCGDDGQDEPSWEIACAEGALAAKRSELIYPIRLYPTRPWQSGGQRAMLR